MKLSLFTLSFYLFVSTAVAGVAPRDYGNYDNGKTTVTKYYTTTKTVKETKVIKTTIKVYPKPATTTKTVTKTITGPKVTVTSTKPAKTITVTKTVKDNGYPVPCYPSTVTNTKTKTITIPTTVQAYGTCPQSTVIETVSVTVPGEYGTVTVTVPTTVELPGTTVTEPTTVLTTVTEATTATEVTTVTEPTTVLNTVTESTTETETTTVTEPTTEVTTVTEPTTVITTVTEPTTITEATTETEVTTVTQPTTVTEPTTVTATVTVTATPDNCNAQPILNPGFEQSYPQIWQWTGTNTASSTGIQQDDDAYAGADDFYGRGSYTYSAWSLNLVQDDIYVCPGRTYKFSAYHKQTDPSNCLIQWYIDNVLLTSGKPGSSWAALSADWTAGPSQTAVEIKMKASCVKGGNGGKMWVDSVALAL